MINYRKSSLQLALDMINNVLGTQFKERDIQFTNIEYQAKGLYNTSAVIKPVVGSGYQDEIPIKYDRVNVQRLFKGIDVRVKPAHQHLLSDYIPFINEAYNLALCKEDIVDGIIPNTATIPFKIMVKIKEDNPAFYGEFSLLISDENRSLSKLFTKTEFDGISYPAEPKKDTLQAPLYFYAVDFSNGADVLSSYQTGWLVNDTLVNMLNNVGPDKWVINSEDSIPFNLYQARVQYNGVIGDNNNYTTKRGYSHVLVIYPDEKYCTNTSGYLLLHYNLATIEDLLGDK